MATEWPLSEHGHRCAKLWMAIDDCIEEAQDLGLMNVWDALIEARRLVADEKGPR